MSQVPRTQPTSTGRASPTRHAVTARALLIGIVGSAAVCFVVVWAELVTKTIQIAICQFAPAAIGMLLFIILINLALRRIWRALTLKPHEIAYIYLMILVTALTVSRGLLERWIPAMIAVNYYATPANHWQELFFNSIPAWAVPWDTAGDPQQPVVKYFYEGLRPGQSIPWRPWVGPMARWLIVISALMLTYLAMASLLRRQWVDNEKLTFPLVQLPVELARDVPAGGQFFRSKLTWLGFAIPTFVFTLNGLHGLHPGIPQIAVKYSLNPVLDSMGRPWRDAGISVAYFSMAAVGFAYFLPTQLLFSLWFFYMFVRFENILFSAFGAHYEAMPLYPTSIWNGYQVAGAYLVLGAYLIRSAFPHLREMWRRAMEGEPVGEAPEMMSARASFLALAVGTIVAIAWFVELGMSPAIAAVEVLVFLFVVVLIMARSVSEAGMLMTETSFRPMDLVRLVTTRSNFSASTLAALAMADSAFTRDLRGNLVSTFLDGLKMADLLNFNRRHLLLVSVLGLLVAIGVGTTVQMYFYYHVGAINMYMYGSGFARSFFKHFQTPLVQPEHYDARLPFFFLSGVIITLFLAYMRMIHTWWPLYPLGFALSGSWSMIVFWFPILVAWIVKSVIMKYGGWRIYSRLRPFFLGLILGEFSQAVIWATIGGIWRVPAPFFPWP